MARVTVLALAAALLVLAAAARAEPVYERVNALVACLESRFPGGGRAVGTGFFVAPKVLATVRHQVRGADAIRIHLADGRRLSARSLVIGEDSDLALVRVSEEGAPSVTPMPSAEARLGDEVFTIGCPLGLSQTMTRGVVSHPDRRIDGQALIQTDLAINRGNSGGPLVNKNGQLLGVVQGTLKASSGIHFAIPAHFLAELMRRAGLEAPVRQDGEVTRMWREALLSGDAATQRKLYEAVILRAPWQAGAYYNLGLVQYRLARYEDARQLFETATLRQGAHAPALTGLGISLYRLGRHQDARDALLRAVSANATDALAQYNLGVVYARGLSDMASAANSFERFLRLAPASPLAAAVRQWLAGLPAKRN